MRLSYRLIAGIFVVLNILFVFIIEGVIEAYFVSSFGQNYPVIISEARNNAIFGLQFWVFIPIPIIVRIIFIFFGMYLIGAGKKLNIIVAALIGISTILTFVLISQLNSNLDEITDWDKFALSYALFPAISLLPIIFTNLFGFGSTWGLIKKLVLFTAFVLFVLSPLVTFSANWGLLKMKHDIGLLHQPTYLPSGPGIEFEKVIYPDIEWWYYCKKYSENSTGGTLIITQSVKGETDGIDNIRSLSGIKNNPQWWMGEFEKISIGSYPGLYEDLNKTIYFEVGNNFVEIQAGPEDVCQITKEELIKIGESMLN